MVGPLATFDNSNLDFLPDELNPDGTRATPAGGALSVASPATGTLAAASPSGSSKTIKGAFDPSDISSILSDLRKTLVEDRKPSKWDEAQKWLAFSAAVGAPTRTGTIGEAASNVSEALGKYAAQRKAAQSSSVDDKLKFLQIAGTLAGKKEFTIDPQTGDVWDLTGDAPRRVADASGNLIAQTPPGTPPPPPPPPGAGPQPNVYGVTRWNGEQWNAANPGAKFPKDALIVTDRKGNVTVADPGTKGTERVTIRTPEGETRVVERPQNAPSGTTYTQVATDIPAGEMSFTGYDPDLTGPALYAEIVRKDPNKAKLIDAIHEGRVLPPATGTRSKEGEKLLALTNGVYPDFDATVAKGRFNTRTAYSPAGATGKNIISFNTAIQHLGEFDEAAKELNNFGFSPLNTVKNIIGKNFDNPAIARFNITRQAVVDELTRAFRMSGGNVSDIKSWEESINDAAGPKSLEAIVGKAATLLGDRLNAVVDPYNKTMGETRSFLSWMPKEARAKYLELNPGYDLTDDDKKYLMEEELAAREKGAQKPAAPAASAATSAPPASALKEGFNTTFGNGQVWTLRNGTPTKVK